MKNITLSTQSLEPLFKKIESLDKVHRLLICIGTIVLFLGLFWLLVSPILEQTKQYQAEYETTNTKLNVAKQKAMQLESLKNERKMKEMEFRKVMKALPETKEIPALLTSISQAGQGTGIEFTKFEPKDEKSQGFYGEIPVNMEIVGNFHNTVMFFDKVTSLNRIVNIRNIKIDVAQSKDNSETAGTKIKTACEAVTYKFVEPGQEQAANANTKKGKAKPKAGAGKQNTPITP